MQHFNCYNMEELVEKLINLRTDGVMMTEMEAILQRSRLRLGYVTRKLLNEGKISKIDNRYYPVMPTNHQHEINNL